MIPKRNAARNLYMEDVMEMGIILIPSKNAVKSVGEGPSDFRATKLEFCKCKVDIPATYNLVL